MHSLTRANGAQHTYQLNPHPEYLLNFVEHFIQSFDLTHVAYGEELLQLHLAEALLRDHLSHQEVDRLLYLGSDHVFVRDGDLHLSD